MLSTISAASHVTMSVMKLLARITAPSIEECEEGALAATLHDHTYGITSDPMTQFACIFSGMSCVWALYNAILHLNGSLINSQRVIFCGSTSTYT